MFPARSSAESSFWGRRAHEHPALPEECWSCPLVCPVPLFEHWTFQIEERIRRWRQANPISSDSLRSGFFGSWFHHRALRSFNKTFFASRGTQKGFEKTEFVH